MILIGCITNVKLYKEMVRLRLLFYLLLTFTPWKLIFAQVSPATNVISVDVSTLPQNGTFNYDSTFSLGTAIGMQQTGLYFNWTTLETAPLTYDFSLPDIANIYYPAFSMPVDLTITPIHTNVPALCPGPAPEFVSIRVHSWLKKTALGSGNNFARCQHHDCHQASPHPHALERH